MAEGRASIARQTAMRLSALTVSALLLAAGALVANHVVSFRREAERGIAVLGDLIGAQAVSALAFGNAEQATEILSALSADEQIVLACLYPREGPVFAWYRREAHAQDRCPGPGALAQASGWRRLALERTIAVDGERVARIVLLADTTALWRHVEVSTGILAVVVLGAAGLALQIARQLRRALSAPAAQLVAHAEAVARGELSNPLAGTWQGEFAGLADAFRAMTASLRGLVGRVLEGSGTLGGAVQALRTAGTDLEQEAALQAARVGETRSSLERISGSVATIHSSSQSLLAEASTSAASLAALDESVGRVASGLDRLEGSIGTTASATSQLDASIGEIAGSARSLHQAIGVCAQSLSAVRQASASVRELASQGDELSRASAERARAGMEVVSHTLVRMEDVRSGYGDIEASVRELSGRLGSITKVVGVLDDVAAETGMLALNAHIIAAKSGEEGRAFAVVADEVKDLAGETARSAREIASLVVAVERGAAAVAQALGRGAESVAAALDQSRQAGEALERICDDSGRVVEAARGIRERVVGQSEGAERAAEAMVEVERQVAQIERALSEQQASSRNLAATAEALGELGADVRREVEHQLAESRTVAGAIARVRDGIAQIAQAARSQAEEGIEISRTTASFEENAREAARRAAALNRVVEDLHARSSALDGEVRRFRL